MSFKSPISLALAVANAASMEGAAFRRTRTSADGEEEAVDLDHGLDPTDTDGLAGPKKGQGRAGGIIDPGLG